MATRSRIGIVNEDGTVSSIYCHWDGYPSNNGRILVEDYTDRDKVKSLIELGSISSLDKHVEPPSIVDENDTNGRKGERMLKKFGFTRAHSFDNPMPGVTVAYHRDRGEDYIEPRVDSSLEKYFLYCYSINRIFYYLKYLNYQIKYIFNKNQYLFDSLIFLR